MNRSAAAEAERRLSDRIRDRWRLQAVDDDLLAALGRRVLVAGRDLLNIGMELKSVEAGPLDLNHRQFEVLRSTREDTPPFVFQFTAPPDHPWCFRIHALRDDSLDALGRRPYVTLTESQAEGFTATLVIGINFASTHVEPARFRWTDRNNQFEGTCVVCGGRVRTGKGHLLQSTADRRWVVAHPNCENGSASSVEIVFDRGEPAIYLEQFSNDPVPDDVWPDVIPPSTYAETERREPYIRKAAGFLQLMGVLDDAPEQIPRRPLLTVLRQQTSAAEIVERVLARIRTERAETAGDDAEPAGGEQTLPPSAVVRCDGCGLVTELDLLGAAPGDHVAECDECRSPIFVIALSDDPVYLAGFGAGWEAHTGALHQVKEQLKGRIEHGPWVNEHAQDVLRRPVPGPFGGSDRQWSYGGPIRGDPVVDHDTSHWDWTAIEEREQRARQKGASLPKCSVCGRSLWLGQETAHYACIHSGRGSPSTNGRFHPDAIATQRAHERTCPGSHAAGELCPAQPDPGDLAQIWAGRARMAAARRAAGVPLDEIDHEALQRSNGESPD